ncbi:MAG: hypothetical protein Q7U82_05285 [Gammaproteobacteria bacterium]|nr:hypothetical protein [Gammaproteobacteria bacterium]
MNFFNFKNAVLAATLMTGLISAPSQAGQLTTIKAVAGVEFLGSGSNNFVKYAFIVTSSPITCGGNSSDRLKITLGQLYMGAYPTIDPFFENYSTLLTAAQNNLTIEINVANPASNGTCEIPPSSAGYNPQPLLIYFQ